MRITLNLASKAYVELRPLYQRLRLLMLLLLVTAAGLWWVLRSVHARAAEAEARVAAIQNSVSDVQRQRQRSEAEMRRPDNAATLAQAQFLNSLFLQKAFSWTAVMMDLEQVLPSGVQVMNIDPQVAKDGRVTIRMRVAGPRERAVDLMRNLEHSRRFLQPRLVGESTQSNAQNGGNLQTVSTAPLGVNFDILADYNPLPERKGTDEKTGSGSGAGAKAGRGRGRRAPKPAPGIAPGVASAPNAAAPTTSRSATVPGAISQPGVRPVVAGVRTDARGGVR